MNPVNVLLNHLFVGSERKNGAQCALNPVDVIIRHASEEVYNQPKTCNGELSENESQEKRPGALEQGWSPIAQNQAFNKPG